MSTTGQQPYLHELLACVRAPALALTAPDGQLQDGVQGVYVTDRRILSRSVLTVAGAELAPISGELAGSSATRSVSVVRGLGDPGADPTVWVERCRAVSGAGASETITLTSAARQPVTATLTLELACDLAGMAAVKAGLAGSALPAARQADGLSWTGPSGIRVSASTVPPPARIAPHDEHASLSWDVELGRGETALIELTYAVSDPVPPVVIAATGPSRLAVPAVRAADPRLSSLLAQSVADLAALELADPRAPQDHFLGAGAPWYLTLFGRDCLIAARMALPLGTELAAGTLRTLARRQGSRVDRDSAEEPGKILHEIRAAETEHSGGHHRALRLPATYYGTVDATPLWILLLHDSWRWGLSAQEVEPLLPNLERALAWMAEFGVDDNGFLSYADRSGHGLTNQGWKDSADSIQFRDGRLAEPPVALSEVQAYGYAAARAGAALLDAFGRPGAQEWRSWAAGLAERFRQRFWLADEHGRYPALALDGSGEPVDSVASDMGHLLGTGLLNEQESALVARRLGSPELSSGFGLRTLADSSAGFNPLSYHAGSVWTHDTAIAITGLAAAAADGVAGAGPAAATLIEGLLAAAPAFGYRMPELHGGHRAEAGRRPIPYPASCRPQAWSAASAMAIVTALLGPRPDAPAGTLEFRPLRSTADAALSSGPDAALSSAADDALDSAVDAALPLGELAVTGLRFVGRTLSVRVTADGSVTSSLDASVTG
jgi:glycogen debranching enzyme